MRGNGTNDVSTASLALRIPLTTEVCEPLFERRRRISCSRFNEGDWRSEDGGDEKGEEGEVSEQHVEFEEEGGWWWERRDERTHQ